MTKTNEERINLNTEIFWHFFLSFCQIKLFLRPDIFHCVWKSTKNVSFSRTICIFVCIWIFGPKVIKINGARFARSQWGKMRLFEWFLKTLWIFCKLCMYYLMSHVSSEMYFPPVSIRRSLGRPIRSSFEPTLTPLKMQHFTFLLMNPVISSPLTPH